jgi:hypothetical protein
MISMPWIKHDGNKHEMVNLAHEHYSQRKEYVYFSFYLGKKMIIGTIHTNKSYKSISSGPKQKSIKMKSLEMSI